MALSVDRSVRPEIRSAYARLEDKILERDQKGASDILYDLVRAQVPLAELVGQIVRIHAPYTHVPYHQRLDDGIVRFVNNDHCLLSSRATLDLVPRMPPELAYLPGGADDLVHADRPRSVEPAPRQDARPLRAALRDQVRGQAAPARGALAGPGRRSPSRARGRRQLNTWLTLVQRGEVINAYRVFLGLWEEAGADRTGAPRCSPSSSSPVSSTCRTGCFTTARTPPATSPIAPGPRSRSRGWSAGRTRTRSSTRACPTSRWVPAGTRATRWAASSCRTSSTIATGRCSRTTAPSARWSRWPCRRRC